MTKWQLEDLADLASMKMPLTSEDMPEALVEQRLLARLLEEREKLLGALRAAHSEMVGAASEVGYDDYHEAIHTAAAALAYADGKAT